MCSSDLAYSVVRSSFLPSSFKLLNFCAGINLFLNLPRIQWGGSMVIENTGSNPITQAQLTAGGAREIVGSDLHVELQAFT